MYTPKPIITAVVLLVEVAHSGLRIGDLQLANAAISGVVLDATHAPLRNVAINALLIVNGNLIPRLETRTDSDGVYTLRGLKPGRYRLLVRAESRTGAKTGPASSKEVSISDGQSLTSVDFALRAFGTIAGRIVGANSEPVPGMGVFLVTRQYVGRMVGYGFVKVTKSDGTGAYELTGLEPGRTYFVLARALPHKLTAVSSVPLEPAMRLHIPTSTYYPGTGSAETAEAFVLNPGERREGVDFRMQYSPSYCLETTVPWADRRDTAADFRVHEVQPLDALILHIGSSGGSVGQDGRIRVCDLYPGDYRLLIYSSQLVASNVATNAPERYPAMLSMVRVTITDEDIIQFVAGRTDFAVVSGEVVWEDNAGGDVPKTSDTLELRAAPKTRSPWLGESQPVRAQIPGPFRFERLYIDDYVFKISGVPQGVYVKGATYAGRDILKEPLRPGTGIGSTSIRITLATDGGSLAVQLADKDRNPVSNACVFVVASSSASEGEIASSVISGQSDQKGSWLSPTLAPGKYRVIATTLPVPLTPETISWLYQIQDRFETVEVKPKDLLQTTVVPVTMQ